MKYLALAMLLAVMQAPPPIPRKTANNPTPSRQNVKKHPSGNNAPAANPQPSLQPVSPQPDQNTSQKIPAENAQQTVRVIELPPVSVGKDRLDKIYICLTGVLVIVGILGVRAAYKTLKAIEEQTKETANSVKAIDRQAGIMERQTSKLEDSVAAARDNTSALINIERAWLVAEVSPPCNFSQNIGNGVLVQGFGFKWAVKNCGNTPGFITKIGARFHTAKSLSELPTNPKIDEPGIQLAETYAVGIPLAPGARLTRCRLREPNGRYPSDEEMKLINDGAIHCLAYGVIEYKSVADATIYKTWFCYRWLPNEEIDVFPPSPVPANYTQYT